jgi:hypothetical protein
MVKEKQGQANSQVRSRGTLTNLLKWILPSWLENLVWHVLWQNPASATTSTSTHQQYTKFIHPTHKSPPLRNNTSAKMCGNALRVRKWCLKLARQGPTHAQKEGWWQLHGSPKCRGSTPRDQGSRARGLAPVLDEPRA